MDQFFGVIEILTVENIFPVDAHDQGTEKAMLMDHVRFVHYPDCQQMCLWLPEYFSEYNNVIIQNIADNVVIFDEKVEHFINGSIKILLDTLFICPGTYELIINKKSGVVHIIRFKKYPEGQSTALPEITLSKPFDVDSDPIVYRDGFGNVLHNEDLVLRQNIIDKTIDKITRRLEYISQGRGGEVIYLEDKKNIKFYMEMGGGNCVFYLDIPSISEWEKTTNFPLSEREDIITFVAEQTRRDQASSCNYKISDTEITYFRK
jgi:hypothetical protein